MGALARSYFILGFVSLALLVSGCQKSSPKAVRGTLGKTGVTEAQDQSEQKIDKLIAEGKTMANCSPVILSRYEELKAQFAKAKELLAARKDVSDMEDEEINALTKSSVEINKAYQVLAVEIAKSAVASCGVNQKLSLDQLRDQTLASVVEIADRLGQETPESKAARLTLKRLASGKSSDVLEGMILKISKTLADSLDEQSQKNVLFVANGNIGHTQASYDEALRFTSASCLLTVAPAKRFEENAEFKILKTEVLNSNSGQEHSKQVVGKVAPSKVHTLAVRMTSGGQVLSFECRLGSDLKKESVASQFLGVFQGLFHP